MGKIPYVGLRMTIAELKKYLEALSFTTFKPQFTVVHHTASPNLSQRPNGFTDQHLVNLKYYYENVMNWNGAPHFFVDDKGIIVFQALNKPGVHAKSYNSNSWGIEMLGDYDTLVDFNSPRAKEIFENTHELVGFLCHFLKVEPSTLKFHRDDPLTNKTCPGKLVEKSTFVKEVNKFYQTYNGDGIDSWTNPVFEITFESNVFIWSQTRVENSRTIVPARAFINKLMPKNYALAKVGGNIVWMNGIKGYSTKVAEVDESGNAWIFLRDICEKTGAKFELIRAKKL